MNRGDRSGSVDHHTVAATMTTATSASVGLIPTDVHALYTVPTALVTDWSQIPRDEQGQAGDIGDWRHVAAGSRGDCQGRQGTSGDAAGKAVNRKVVGSSPSSGAISELESARRRHSET